MVMVIVTGRCRAGTVDQVVVGDREGPMVSSGAIFVIVKDGGRRRRSSGKGLVVLG